MRQYIIKALFLVIAVLFLSGCASMYIPPSSNIPLLQEKHETQIEAGATTNSLYLMTAFAVTDKWALMANGNLSYYNFSNIYDIFNVDEYSFGILSEDGHLFAHRYAELGFGRFNLVDSSRLKLELFGGGGYGYAFSHGEDNDKDRRENRYFLIFSQVDIGSIHNLRKANHYFEIGGSFRLAYSHFDYSYNPAITESPLKFNNIHLEPTGMIRIGSKSVRFIAKVGLAVRFTFEDYGYIDKNYVDNYGLSDGKPITTHTHISVGVNFKLGGKKQ